MKCPTLEGDGENGVGIDVSGFFGVEENGRASEGPLERRLGVGLYEGFDGL